MVNPPSHGWLRAHRNDTALKQDEVERLTAALGAKISRQTLATLESGRRFLRSLRPDQAAALCTVLGITAEEWATPSVWPQPDGDQT